MDDRKLNPLRFVLLFGIIGYFTFLFTRPEPTALVAQPPLPAAISQPAPAPQPAAPAANCAGEITQVAFGTYELRLQITGAAERILVYTDQGNLVVSTTEAGSAGLYRVRTPGPPTAVQLDDCPVLNLR